MQFGTALSHPRATLHILALCFKSPLLRCVNLLTLGTEIEDDRMKNFNIALSLCKKSCAFPN